MSQGRLDTRSKISSLLAELESEGVINGLGNEARRLSLTEQIIESYRRIEYVRRIRDRDISDQRCDPESELFDPLKAAVSFHRAGDLDESFWMIFLFVHFGKNARGGWRYAREVYNALGQRERWTWQNTSSDPKGFRTWLASNAEHIKRKNPPGGFGNHRKYTSLKAHSGSGTGAAFESYVDWIGLSSHQERFSQITLDCENDSASRFDALCQSMSEVKSFGRMAIFDYLCMVGKVGLFDVEPGSVYVANATGPKAGGKLLFAGDSKAKCSNSQLEEDYAKLGAKLKLPFIMQVLEDAICNWQKSPDKFRAFRG